MTQLYDLKETICNYYQKYEEYIRPVLKLIFSFLVLLFLSRMFGYNMKINKVYIFLILSAMQAFLPISFVFYTSTALVAGNLWMVSPEIMAVYLIIMLICWLTFVRLDQRYAVLVVLTPVLFYLKMEYMLPVLVGMVSGISGVLPVAGGILIYFISSCTADVSALLAASSGNGAGIGIQRMIHLMAIDKKLLVLMITFCLIIFISGILYRMFHERAWMFTVIIGNITLALLLLSGRLIFELEYTIWRVFLETVLAVGIAAFYQFFKGVGDVSRIEKISFEDDEYIYYVKAVPKIKVPLTDRNVTQITPEDPEEFDMPEELPDHERSETGISEEVSETGSDEAKENVMEQARQQRIDRGDLNEHRTYTESD